MAIIYDISTGKVIPGAVAHRLARQAPPAPDNVGLQPLHEVNHPLTAAACDAYLVLLQRLLKDL
jgi:hypothetical protein